MTLIHPTAVVDPAAEIGSDVEIGPYVVIQGPVRVGRGSVLHAHATVLGDTTLGEENVIHPGAVLGAPPQDLKYAGEPTRLVVGDRNRFREHVTAHPGTGAGGGLTLIGSDNLFMVGSHVAHDCRIGDRVILANHVLLAGHVVVKDRAILNGASACHHFTTIGRLAYVGGLTRITQDVHPFTVVEGHPARVRACNTVGMERAGFDPAAVARVRAAVYAILVSDKTSAAEACVRLEAEHPDEPLVAELIASVRASQAGRQGRAAEPVRGAEPAGS
jgi:UDP-N-acetylglucosamine acyltransferase